MKPTEVFPVVFHASTAWLRWLFEVDPEPVGLDQPPADAYEVEVTALAK